MMEVDYNALNNILCEELKVERLFYIPKVTEAIKNRQSEWLIKESRQDGHSTAASLLKADIQWHGDDAKVVEGQLARQDGLVKYPSHKHVNITKEKDCLPFNVGFVNGYNKAIEDVAVLNQPHVTTFKGKVGRDA